jgi:hypothetical protein
MISKKKLLSLIEINLKEMPVDYGQNPERMNPDIERKLASQETPFKDNKAIPQGKPDEGITSNFEELLASKRFQHVVQKVKQYSGVQGNVTSENTFAQLFLTMRQAFATVKDFENRHKEELERLAIEVITKEMKIPENALNFDVNLVNIGDVPDDGFQENEENPSEEEVQQEFGIPPQEAEEDIEQFMGAMEEFNDEVAKRRFMNALIQGSAQKGYYMFELVNERLNQMQPGIVRLYGILMSVNDLMYWILPDEMIKTMHAPGMKAGKEQVEKPNDEDQDGDNQPDDNDQEQDGEQPQQEKKATVHVSGVFFPVLLHELIKGVMETMATQGLPDSENAANMVMGKADTLPNEMWDLRLGPVIWEKFLESYPDRIFAEDAKHIQHYFFSRFSKLSADEFFRLARLIIKGDPMGKEIVERMVAEIEEHLKNEDWRDEEYRMDYDDGDIDNDGDSDGLKGFLGDLGIGLSDDDK